MLQNPIVYNCNIGDFKYKLRFTVLRNARNIFISGLLHCFVIGDICKQEITILCDLLIKRSNTYAIEIVEYDVIC